MRRPDFFALRRCRGVMCLLQQAPAVNGEPLLHLIVPLDTPLALPHRWEGEQLFGHLSLVPFHFAREPIPTIEFVLEEAEGGGAGGQEDDVAGTR